MSGLAQIDQVPKLLSSVLFEYVTNHVLSWCMLCSYLCKIPVNWFRNFYTLFSDLTQTNKHSTINITCNNNNCNTRTVTHSVYGSNKPDPIKIGQHLYKIEFKNTSWERFGWNPRQYSHSIIVEDCSTSGTQFSQNQQHIWNILITLWSSWLCS